MPNLTALFPVLGRWQYQSISTTVEDGPDDTTAKLCEVSQCTQQINSRYGQVKWKWQTICSSVTFTLLCANLLAFLILIFGSAKASVPTSPIVQSLSDTIFGHIPVGPVAWQPDKAFTSTDPWDGAYWNNGSGTKGSTPWDDLFRSGWIAVENPRSHGLSGGVPLRRFAPAQFKDVWSNSAEGYNPTVIHQLHCVGILKHLIQAQKLSHENNSNGKAYGQLDNLFEHGQHCIEYLRQSTMCAADLTLEPPQTIDLAARMIHGTTGWGTTHVCRDWSTVHDRIWEKLVRIYHIQDHSMVAIPDDT